MAVEIERKFLVVGDAWKHAAPIYYAQGYLNTDPHRTVRVRIAGDAAFLTVKGKTHVATRAEFEYAIPLDDAQALLALCEQPLVEKTRRCISVGGFVWEVDAFLGENEGLVVAEIELPSEHCDFPRPEWLGQEVTGDNRYFNSNLVKNPFKSW